MKSMLTPEQQSAVNAHIFADVEQIAKRTQIFMERITRKNLLCDDINLDDSHGIVDSIDELIQFSKILGSNPFGLVNMYRKEEDEPMKLWFEA